MVESISALRWIGLLVGAACLAVVVIRLMRRPNDPTNTFILTPTGVLLIGLSLFPAIGKIPAELFRLSEVTGGPLLTLTVIAVGIMWFVVIYGLRANACVAERLDDLQVALAAQQAVQDSLPELRNLSILVILPAFNEADNLPQVLPRIPDEVEGKAVRVVVIDDGSDDGTAEIARAHGAIVVEHPATYGGGLAVRTGYRVGRLIEVEYLVTLDADGQHNPEEIRTLLHPLFQREADLVVGSRQLGTGERHSVLRAWGVYVFSKGISILMNADITDCASGFRAFRVSALNRLKLSARQYHTTESIIIALKNGLRVTEVPITISRRISGASKKGHDVLYGFNFLRATLRAWWR